MTPLVAVVFILGGSSWGLSNLWTANRSRPNTTHLSHYVQVLCL